MCAPCVKRVCCCGAANVHCVQVLVCQLLMDGMKAYNCLLPLVTALPRQGPPFPASKSVATWWFGVLGILFGVGLGGGGGGVCHRGCMPGGDVYALRGLS